MKKSRRYKQIWLVWLVILSLWPKQNLAYRPAALLIDFSHVDPGQEVWRQAWAAGFGVAFPLSPRWAFFLNFSRWRFNISARDKRFFDGHLTLSPLTCGFYYLVFPQKIISPILTLGGGYFFSEYQFNREKIITIPEIIKLNQKVRGKFAWQWGGGVVIRLSKKAHLWLQLERHQTSLSIDTIIEDLNLGVIKKREEMPFRPLLYRFGLQVNLF